MRRHTGILVIVILFIVMVLPSCRVSPEDDPVCREIFGTPRIDSISPSRIVAGGPAFNLTVLGNAFFAGAQVLWNGQARPTLVDTAGRVIASISAADIAHPGTVQITVVVPSQDPPFSEGCGVRGGTSNALTLTIDPAPITVTINSAASQLQAESSLQFTAIITGSNAGVTWSVNGIAGGDATVGTISNTGLYTAPTAVPNPNNVSITATSLLDPAKSASRPIKIFAAHRIGVRVVNGEGEFYDRVTGAKFVVRGNNYVRLTLQTDSWGGTGVTHSTFNGSNYDAVRAEQALIGMENLGYNTVRVWLSGCCNGFSLPHGTGPNPAYFANLADFIRRAKTHNLQVMIVDDVPQDGGYGSFLSAYCCTTFDMGFNLLRLSTGGVEMSKQIWRDVVQALIDQDAPLDAVLGYQISEEVYWESDIKPLSLTSGVVTTGNGQSYDMSVAAQKTAMIDDNLVYWTGQVRDAIRAMDPTALVVIGAFAPHGPNPYRIGDPRIVNQFSAFANTSADAVSFSLYPRPGDPNVAGLMQNFGISGPIAKPAFVSELGVFQSFAATSSQAAVVLKQWQVDSCPYGMDGWALWTWDTDSTEQIDGPNWWATAGNGEISSALSPNARPDPCVP
jgi:hypothetical protein